MAPTPPSTSPLPSRNGWTAASSGGPSGAGSATAGGGEGSGSAAPRAADRAAVDELARELGVGPAIAQLLSRRGFADAARARDFLDARLVGLSAPDAMVDRQAAADRIARAVRAGERIVVFGDYDVDGTTSAAILSGVIEQLGGRVRALTANRFEGGYGFSQEALGRVLELAPGLIVTCDCGSSDHPRIAEARRRGIDVVVVDHHLVPAEPLPALAFLNPHRPDCGFAYKGLCSAGLALSLGAALRVALGAELDLRPWLDLVALGTIADVAPLDGDNRRLVRAGLARLGSPLSRPGVVALREIAKIRPGTPVGGVDVAFRMTPRLNAPGRLGDQSLSLSLLRARSLPEARALAARIEQLNQERKEIERRVTAEAEAQIIEIYGERPTAGVVAAAEGWHRGVVGISAARLTERFGVPAVVVALEAGEGHGSARAPDGFPLFDAIERNAAELVRFGGHQAASGVTLRAERLEAFRAGFADASRELLARAVAVAAAPPSDVIIAAGGFGLPRAGELALLEPLGEGNPEPIFELSEAHVLASREVGEGHLKLELAVGDDRLSAFGLGMAQDRPTSGVQITALGPLRPDTWEGGDRVELRLLSYTLG